MSRPMQLGMKALGHCGHTLLDMSMVVKAAQVVWYWNLLMATVIATSSTWAGSPSKSMKHIIIPSTSHNIASCLGAGTRDIVSMGMLSSTDLERRAIPGCDSMYAAQSVDLISAAPSAGT